jgi:hypothetical protein
VPRTVPLLLTILNQLSNDLQIEQADLIRDSQPFSRPELEEYLDGVRRAINGLARAALALQQVNRRLVQEGGGQLAPSTGK